MNFEEAHKKVTAAKIKENYMVIKMSWGHKIVLPYKDGVTFINSLSNAEALNEPYDGQHTISEIDRNVLETHLLSHAEYVRIKVAALLGIKPADLIKIEPEPAHS